MPKTLDTLTNEEFDQLVEQHIDQAAQWDGTLPLDTILETWATIEHRKQPPVVRIRLVEGQIVLETPPESPLSVQGSSTLILEDGSELNLEFEPELVEAVRV